MSDSALPRPAAMAVSTWGLLVLLGIIWGGSFFFARVAVQQIPPMTLVLLRVVLAGAALHLFLAGRYGLYRHLAARWPAFLIMGLLNNAVPFTLIFAGQTAIGAGLASILNATTPVWTVLVAHVFTSDEKLRTGKVLGCVLGLAGTVALIGPDALAATGTPVWAELAIIGATLSYACAAAFARRFSRLPAPVTATGQLTASSLLMLPMALIVDRPWTLPMPGTEVVAAVLALAWLSTAFAYVLYFRIIQLAGATNASLVTLIVPPSAILLGGVFLGERLEWSAFAAMAMIAVGLLAIDGRLGAWLRQRTD